MRYKNYLPHPRARLFSILMLQILVGFFATAACGAATGEAGDELTLAPFVAGIVTRSAELTYVTEQDSEVVAFYRPTSAKDMTDAVFLGLLRRPAETRIIRESWSAFFQLRTSNDPTGRWRILQQYLEAHLTDLVVFRLPRDAPYEAQYDLYAVGIFDGKTVVGIQMFGVAT